VPVGAIWIFAFAIGVGTVGAGVTGGVGVGDVVFVPPLHAEVAAAMASMTATQVFLSIEVPPQEIAPTSAKRVSRCHFAICGTNGIEHFAFEAASW